MKAQEASPASESNCLSGYGEVTSSETQKLLTSEVWFNFAVTTGWWGVWADFICPHPDKAEVGRDSDSKLDLPEASELVFGSLKQSEG